MSIPLPPSGQHRNADPAHADHRAHALQCLRALVAELGRSAKRLEARTGLSNAQLFVLRQVREGERARAPLSVGEVAQRAFIRQNTASSLVGRLVTAGLVRSAVAPDERRRRELTLTARGRALLARAAAPPTARVVDALARLTGREARALAASLDQLVRVMHLEVAQPPMLFEQNHRPATRPRRASP